MSLGVVVPAYKPDTKQLITYLHRLDTHVYPECIRIELDGSLPALLDTAIRERSFDATVTVNRSKKRRGKGAAIMSGFDALLASTDVDVLAYVDADGSTHAASFVDVIRPVEQGRADISLGSRRHPDSVIISHQTVVRRYMGNIFAWAGRQVLSTKCRDYQCGAKAISAATWRRLRSHCYEPGFAWDVEFISVAGAIGCDIIEVPILWEDHPGSTVDPLSAAFELGTALFDIQRRTAAIAESPHFFDQAGTSHSRLVSASTSHDHAAMSYDRSQRSWR